MNERRRRARSEQGGTGTGGHEPLFIGISEGVSYGYEALEYVLAGLAESIRIRRRGDGDKPPYLTEGEPLTIEQLVEMFAELLENLGNVAEEAARYVGGLARGPHVHGAEEVVVPPSREVSFGAESGKVAGTEFHITNTAPSVMTDVTLAATDLAGPGGARIPAEAVLVEPDHFEKLAIGEQVAARVGVAVPEGTPPGRYSGLLVTRPGTRGVQFHVTVEPQPPAEPEAPPPKTG